jgi:hypothetical protein
MLDQSASAVYARDILSNATKNLRNLLTIHYATGPLRDAKFEQMPIYCIVVQDAGGKQRVFCGQSERDFLDQFFHFVGDHVDHLWLHWGMGDERYGFDQIAKRHRFLGGSSSEIPDDKQVDLPSALKVIYGRDFADHPRLTTILKVKFTGGGGHGTDELLSSEQLIEASKQGNVPLLRKDARRKVRGIFDLLILHDQGRLVANPTRTKRSTEKGEGQSKLIAALTKHHQYADDCCPNTEPIGVRALARLAEVDPSTASVFFNVKFNRGEKKGWSVYRVVCRDAGRLVDSLKALNDEFSPHDLYGRRPRGEDDNDRDEE